MELESDNISDIIADDIADVDLVETPKKPTGKRQTKKQAAANDNTQAEKRPVGRPPTKPKVAAINIKGVLGAPQDPEHSLELKYHDPAMFSKILKLYKNYDVNDVEMKFSKTGVAMAANDHLGKSKIYVTIDGACMDGYYCAEPMTICIKRAHLEYAILSCGKDISCIDFICLVGDTKKLYVIIRGSEYENDSQYEIEISPKVDNVIEDAIDDSTYPIQFSITMTHFKTKIAQAEKIGKTLTIEKVGLGRLQLVGDNGPGKQVQWSETYTLDAKIGLVSTIADGDILRTPIIIDHIQPFAKTGISDSVHIRAHKTEKISLTSSTNSCAGGYACTVKVFTSLT